MMVRNDYRRSLIMLRSHERGYSGHVRLEHRTMTGSMYFVIGAPQSSNPLCAALVRRDADGVYFAQRIGELRRDSRGQATLAYSFDPRNIGGRPLDDYILITVVVQRPDRCDLVLSGNVNGSREVNLSAVATASCYACQGNRPSEPDSYEPPVCPVPPRPEPEPPVRPAPPVPEQTPGRPGMIEPRTGGKEGEFLSGNTIPASDLPEAPAQVEDEVSDAYFAEMDVSGIWPGAAETVRQFFVRADPAENAPDDGYFYVRAPMDSETGYDSILIGVLPRDGGPDRIAYALPGVYSAEPPAGMEDYIWHGDEDNGWWIVRTDAQSGEVLI